MNAPFAARRGLRDRSLSRPEAQVVGYWVAAATGGQGSEVSAMDEPVVYPSTWRIKNGTFPAYRRFYAELLKRISGPDQDVVAFYAFGNADDTEITNVQSSPTRRPSTATWR